VRSRQFFIAHVLLCVFYNVELHAAEAVDGSAIGPRREGQERTPLIIRPLFKHDFPQPLNSTTLFTETAAIFTSVLQVFEVKGALSTNQLLKITRRQNRLQNLDVDHALEALLEVLDLLLTLLLEFEINEETDKFMSVFSGYGDLLTVWHKFDFFVQAKMIRVDCHRSAKHVLQSHTIIFTFFILKYLTH